MRSKILRYLSLVLLYCLMAGSVIAQQGAGANQPNSTTDKDWWKMMQDPNANFFETVGAFNDYWKDRPVKKGSCYKPFKRWEYLMKGRIDKDGNKPKSGQAAAEYYKFQQSFPESILATWTQVGPTSLPTNNTSQPNGMGRINGIGFHPTNTDVYYVAAASGGIWKTFDNGSYWVSLTDELPTLGASTVVVDHTNPAIVYFGSGDRDSDDAPGMGVFKSTNNGGTFSLDTTGMGFATVNMLIMHPTNHLELLAATSKGIYKTTNGGDTWVRKENYYYRNFKDIKYKPGNPLIAYAVEGGSFYRSTNGGEAWSRITNGIVASTRLVIGVSPAQPDWVYLCSANPTFAGLLKSVNSGESFSTISNSPNILGYAEDGNDTKEQSGYDLAIAVSPTNANHIYIGGINIWRSTNGGAAWEIVNFWSEVGSVHADIHSLDYNPLNGQLFCGNDGGLHNTVGGTEWNDLSGGLSISQIYKIGQSNYQQGHIMCGYQDNGTTESNGGAFTTVCGGDGLECLIDWADDERTYFTVVGDNGPLIYRDVSTGQASIAGYNTNGINEIPTWGLPYMLDRVHNHTMFAGFVNVWKSTDIDDVFAINVEWSRISDSETSQCSVIAQPMSDNNILYVARTRMVNSSGYVYSPASLKRTDNAQATSPTWVSCSLPEGNEITDLETESYDTQIVYATTSQGVYKSYDRGLNWENISDNLPDVPINCIVQETLYGTERLYVGTQVGVFYKNEFMQHWASFSQGLPVTDVRELEIYHYYDESRIKAATYGRGLWQSPLFSFPDYPTFVQASDGAFPDHVHVTWSPATGEGFYQVYRGTYNNPMMAEPITGWITDLQYDDYNPMPGINQYYWVISSPDEFGSDPSAFNSSDVGNIAAPIDLTEELISLTTAPTNYYTFSNPIGHWCIAGVKSNIATDVWNMNLYTNNSFQTLLPSSTAPTQNNYVLVDNYHAPSSVYGLKAVQATGTDDAYVEFEDGAENLNVNTVQVFTWPAGDVADVFNVHLRPGVYTFSMTNTTGTGNLDIALYGSVTGEYYQSRSYALAYSTNPGQGSNESFTYTITVEDDYAFVVFSNDNNAAGGYYMIEGAGMWTGYADNNWHNPANWSGNIVPDETTDVTIPPMTNKPWIYAGTAHCRNLTLQPGTNYLRLYNQFLVVHGDMTIHRQLMMDNPTPDAHLTVYGNIIWESGSSAWIENNTYISVRGNWTFKPGSNAQINGGIVIFSGNGASEIISGDDDCHFNDVTLAKTDANVIISSASTDTLNINGNLVVNAGSGLFGYSNMPVSFKANVTSMGLFYLNTGVCYLDGANQNIQMTEGNFYRNLVVKPTSSVNLLSSILVQGSLTIHHGVLDCNSNTISVTENWLNEVGTDGFLEETGTVVFNGGNYAQYCSSESFYNLQLNKALGGALRIWAALVDCQHYKWYGGAIDVNLGVFQAADLEDNGIYGDWYVNPLSYVNVTNSDGYVDLNGNLLISGGEFHVYGGLDASYWAYEANAGLLMIDGILDFHNVGINMVPTSHTLTTLVNGGTIRTSGYFNLSRDGFAPSGGTVELYGPSAAFVGQSSGVSFHDLRINKSDATSIVTAANDLTINHDLTIQQGVFEVNANTVYIGNDMQVSSTVRMGSETSVVRVARHYNWNAGSSVQMYGPGTFRALGNWTYAVGSNVNMTQGNVNFLGDNESIIYCNESNSKFYNLWVNKTGSSPVTIDYYSSDTLNVLGDLLIFSNKNLVSHTPWPINVQGVFDNDGHYKFNNGEITLHTPYTISPGAGDYFSTLRLQGPALTPFTFDFSRNDTLRVNLDVNIVSGSLNMMNKILAFGRHWNNMAGESGFVEGSGQVIANGFSGITQNILNDETFYNFTIQPLHLSDYPVVSLYSPIRTLNVGNYLTVERGKLLLTQNASLVVGNDFVLREQGSLFAEGSQAIVSIAQNWYDYTADITNETGFTYGNTTVTFNGSPNQYIYQYGSGLSKFYNLNVYKYGGTLSPQGNVEIRGDLTVQLGNYERVDNGHEIFLYGNLSTNPGTGFYPRGILRCFGNSNTSLAINGNGWLGSVVVNKAEPTNSVSLLSNVVSMNSGELSVYNGQLNLGSHYYRCTAAVNVSTYGKLSIGDDGWLEVGGSSYLNVNGTLEVLGSAGHEAKVTHHSGYYDFDINSGASVAANHAIFEYMTANGVHLWGGANVDASNCFNNCTFRYGIAGGTLFTVDNAQDITATNVNFPTNTNASLYNVAKTTDQGSITFLESTGAFAGETFENDVYGRVNWGYPVKNLSLMVYLEGLYSTTTGQMNKAHNASGEQFEGLKADEVSLELRSSGSPYSLIHSASNLTLNMDGSIVTTLPGNLSGSYYVAIKNRNHLETWSAAPVSFAGSTISYNFTDAAARAYGSNQKEVLPNTFGLYAGDANQDGAINADDSDNAANQASLFATGYIPQDINGDGSVDALDLILIDNNAAMARSVAHP